MYNVFVSSISVILVKQCSNLGLYLTNNHLKQDYTNRRKLVVEYIYRNVEYQDHMQSAINRTNNILNLIIKVDTNSR
jgi:hypothetical protein